MQRTNCVTPKLVEFMFDSLGVSFINLYLKFSDSFKWIELFVSAEHSKKLKISMKAIKKIIFLKKNEFILIVKSLSLYRLNARCEIT